MTFDLRPAFATALGLLAFAPADEHTGPSPAANGADVVGGDDAAGEGDKADTDDDDDKPPTKGRIKELSDEAARHRRLKKEAIARAEAAEARIAELETGRAPDEVQAEVRSLRLELAWERSTRTVPWRDDNAAEMAWTHVREALQAVKVEDDGTVDASAVGTIVNHVVEKYPFLIAPDEPADELAPRWPDDAAMSTGKPARRQTKGSGADYETLARKFPALRHR